jgi:hypothetical protein
MVTAQDMAAQAGWAPKGLNLARGQQLADQVNSTQLKQQEIGVSRMNAEANLGLHRAQMLELPAKTRLYDAQAKYYASRPEEAENKLSTMLSIATAKDATTQQKIKEAAEGAEVKSIMADPSAAAIYNSVGGNLQDYKDAQYIAAQKGLTYQPKAKAGGLFKDAKPAGWYTAEGTYVPGDNVSQMIHRYRAKRNS